MISFSFRNGLPCVIFAVAVFAGCGGESPKSTAQHSQTENSGKKVTPTATSALIEKTSETKPSGAKLTESKLAESKTIESKPTTSKPTQSKPSETRPSETKPDELNQAPAAAQIPPKKLLVNPFQMPEMPETFLPTKEEPKNVEQAAPTKQMDRPRLRLLGFANVDGFKALVESKGDVQAIAIGESIDGAQIVSIEPPNVTFQFASARWATKLFDQPWQNEQKGLVSSPGASRTFASQSRSTPRTTAQTPSSRASSPSTPRGPVLATTPGMRPAAGGISGGLPGIGGGVGNGMPMPPGMPSGSESGGIPGMGNIPGLPGISLPGGPGTIPGGPGAVPGGGSIMPPGPPSFPAAGPGAMPGDSGVLPGTMGAIPGGGGAMQRGIVPVPGGLN